MIACLLNLAKLYLQKVILYAMCRGFLHKHHKLSKWLLEATYTTEQRLIFSRMSEIANAYNVAVLDGKE